MTAAYISITEGSGPVVLAAPHGARKLPLSAIKPSQLSIKHDLRTNLLAEELCRESERKADFFEKE